MNALEWSADEAAWTTTLSNTVFDDLVIRVMTDGDTCAPSPIQLQAVAEIERLTMADLSPIDDLARKYASARLDPDELYNMDDDDFAVEIYCAHVPRLRESNDTYVLFGANSEIDPEHGLGCICKNGKLLAVIPADYVYENLDWDSTSQLDTLVNVRQY